MGSCVLLKVIFVWVGFSGLGSCLVEALWLYTGYYWGINRLVITYFLWFPEKVVLSMKEAVLKG